jgi:hypothetical protein
LATRVHWLFHLLRIWLCQMKAQIWIRDIAKYFTTRNRTQHLNQPFPYSVLRILLQILENSLNQISHHQSIQNQCLWRNFSYKRMPRDSNSSSNSRCRHQVLPNLHRLFKIRHHQTVISQCLPQTLYLMIQPCWSHPLWST